MIYSPNEMYIWFIALIRRKQKPSIMPNSPIHIESLSMMNTDALLCYASKSYEIYFFKWMELNI